MDQSNSTNEPGVSNFNLCDECGDNGENSANVRGNEGSSNSGTSPSFQPQAPKRMRMDEENEQSPDIDKLPLEMLAAIFDYLSLKDLCAIRQTSKRFHQVAGFCYHKNYSAFERCIYQIEHKELNAFNEVVQTLHINYLDNFKMHEYYHNGRSEFQQLKRLKISCIDLANLKLEDVKKIVGEIEHLEIGDCKIDRSYIATVPRVFLNLKHLNMRCLTAWKSGSEWIPYEYPKLERFELRCKLDDLDIGSFLEMNPNIRKIALDASVIWSSRESLKSVKLEDLAIQTPLDLRRNPYFPTDCESYCKFLNELHDLGSYERLKVYIFWYCYKDKDQFIKLSSLHALNKLHLFTMCYQWDDKAKFKYADRFELSIFNTLEEIRVPFSCMINDIEVAADNLKNLERIWFDVADLDDIEVFIKRSRTLIKIKVNDFVLAASYIRKTNERIIYNDEKVTDPFPEQQNVINLSKLNAARANLQDAKPVTLYVTEEVYLATKWAMKETDFEFIQLRRHESFKWDMDFGHYY